MALLAGWCTRIATGNRWRRRKREHRCLVEVETSYERWRCLPDNGQESRQKLTFDLLESIDSFYDPKIQMHFQLCCILIHDISTQYDHIRREKKEQGLNISVLYLFYLQYSFLWSSSMLIHQFHVSFGLDIAHCIMIYVQLDDVVGGFSVLTLMLDFGWGGTMFCLAYTGGHWKLG